MKAKLVKEYGDFYLISDDEIKAGDEYVKLDNRPRTLFLGTTIPHVKTVPKLSLKNCQAIERGYDLDELAKEVCDCEANECDIRDEFKKGFQKALELMSDKKFSEEDMLSFESFVSKWYDKAKDVEEFTVLPSELLSKWRSLQQTEWDVEIEMEEVAIGDKYTPEPKPKLDADGYLILKRVI